MKQVVLIVFLFFTHPGQAQDRQDQFSIYFFLHPECPISQQYIPYINSLNDSFAVEIPMHAVFGGNKKKKLMKEVELFNNKYQLHSGIIIDPTHKKAKKWGATITPEVFVIKNENEIVYHGAIDNRYFQLGKLRTEITERYLENVIHDILSNSIKVYPTQKAIGCFLEY